ncbi:MAG: hypothetical protein ABSG86_26295 [Thermoguttaceae bacterium]|jgi:hypothetical protein
MRPIFTLCLAVGITLGFAAATGRAADVFIRLKVVDPPAGKFRVTLGGFNASGSTQVILSGERPANSTPGGL